MKTQLWTGFTRLYFNAYEEAPRFWSLDRGAGTEELKVETVSLEDAGMATVVHEERKVQPRAWLEGIVAVSRTTSGSISIGRIHPV